MKVVVALPAYNEETALPALLDSIIETLSHERREYSIVVVDDGSRDRTGAIIEEYAKKAPVIALHNNPNQGLALTLKRGLLAALERTPGTDDIIITLDADNTQPPGLMPRMIRGIAEGNDVVIASRYREGSRVRGVPFYRELISLGAAMLFKLVLPIRGVRDYTCGFRAYRASLLKELVDHDGDRFVSEKGFSCMVDVLLKLRRFDPVMTEVPMVLRYDLKPGASKMRVIKTIFDTLRLLARRRMGGRT